MAARIGNSGHPAPSIGPARRRNRLQHRLEGLARLPVPPPDPRFADQLLVRLVTTRPGTAHQPNHLSQPSQPSQPSQTSSPSPTSPVPAELVEVGGVPSVESGGEGHRVGRRKPSPARLTMAAVAAAAAVLLLVPPTLDLVESDGARAELATASLASLLGPRSEVRIGPGGALLDRAGRPLVIPDGAATLTCSAAMTFAGAAGGSYRCEAGESVAVRVEQATVVWSSAMPTETDLAALRLEEPGVEQPLRWTWSRLEGPKSEEFLAYELVRGRSEEPALADGTEVEIVARIEDIGRSTFEEPGALDHDVTYQVRALDREGRPLALSNAVQVSVASGG